MKGPDDRTLLRALVSRDSFGLVLLLILATYVISVTLRGPMPAVVLALQMVTVALSIHVSRARRGMRVAANVALVVAAIVAVSYLVMDDARWVRATVFITASVLYVIAPISILRSIVMVRDVDREAVLGAIAAYLLIGMFFGFLYQAGGLLRPEGFFGSGVEESTANYLFFSFTTLTTTGYGNLIPMASPGQAIAVMEMLIGQLFLVTAVAKVISAWRPSRWVLDEDEAAPHAQSSG